MMSAEERSTQLFAFRSARSRSLIAWSSGSLMLSGALLVVARARTRLARLTMPTSLPSGTTGTRLIRFVFEQHGDIGEFGRVADRDGIARHDVPDRAGVRLDIVTSKFPIGSDRVEPPRSPVFDARLRPVLGPGLDAMRQVTFADDADHPLVGIDHANPADPAL